MKIVGHRGTRVHAPENTIPALLSAYTAGADALEFDLQLTRDGHLVLCHDPTTERTAGVGGRILEMTLDELRRLDLSATFRPPCSPGFRYYHGRGHRLRVATLEEALDALPEDVPKLIELKHDSTIGTGRRDEAVACLVQALHDYRQLDAAVVYSMDLDALRRIRALEPVLAIAAFDYRLPPDEQLALMGDVGADGLVTQLATVLDDEHRLTYAGRRLAEAFGAGELRVGAALYPYRPDGLWSLTAEQHAALAGEPWVWSVAVDSVLDAAALTGRPRPWISEPFAGRDVDTARFAFGYAKANRYCHVFQDNGVHVKIAPYDGYPPPPLEDTSTTVRIARLEREMMYVAKDWPYYSGGGFGVVLPVRGNFAAEVDYEVAEPMAQAMTLEMAAVNVDPGAHRRPWNDDGSPRLPRSFRDKDSFYDPHGAPPYVGVEHDEDDGYRINWNLGHDYDNNQYGLPVGDGVSPRAGRLRLERRGAYFSAYYRNDVDALEWVCVGAVRNESLNPGVYLRCAAKRWRQERAGTIDDYELIRPNEFVFLNLTVHIHPSRSA